MIRYKENKIPIIKASICNGEQVAGFKDVHTGAFEEIMLIRDYTDLIEFKERYGITGDIEKIYYSTNMRHGECYT